MTSIKKKVVISVDRSKCLRCGSCEDVCPSKVFTWSDDDVLNVHNPGRCIGCGHCVAVCERAAFKHSELPVERFVDISDSEQQLNAETLNKLFMERRSVRHFKSTLPTRKQIETLIDSARYAPTSTNSQNVRFMLFYGRDKVNALAEQTAKYYIRLGHRLANPLMRLGIGLTVGFKMANAYRFRMPSIVEMFEKTLAGEDRLFYNAPCVAVLFASGLSYLASSSCNLAAMEIMLAAPSHGLGTCINGYALTAMIRDNKIRESLGITSGYTPGAVIAMGVPVRSFCKIPPRNKRRIIWT